IQKKDTEIAFIGLGEPLMYLPKVIKIIKKIKEKYDIKTRVDTNGLVKCMYKDPVKKLVDAGLDEIRISLNAITKKEYDILCRPRFENAFENLISFVKECANSKIYTYVSFVTGFEHEKVKKRTEEEYSKFAESLGIKKENMILRKYVKGIFKK
ncbi:MAG: radical SAM protein, partial [Nanoarchaeota archaeon]|nr:radical SAM protein [Nanoarchaeota archaeon]